LFARTPPPVRLPSPELGFHIQTIIGPLGKSLSIMNRTGKLLTKVVG